MPVAKTRSSKNQGLGLPKSGIGFVTDLERELFKATRVRVVVRVPGMALLNKQISRQLDESVNMEGTIAMFRDALKKALKDGVIDGNENKYIVTNKDFTFIAPNGVSLDGRVLIKNAQWPE